MRAQEYVVLAEYGAEEILSTTGFDSPSRTFVIDGIECVVKMRSLRYAAFKKSPACARCGIIGTVMRLEHDRGCDPRRPHFNLYARTDDGLVLMTKDHIMPRSAGGTDFPDNLQTMCVRCNHEKDDRIPGDM